MAEGTRMQQRRATEAVWNTSDYVLAAGELGVTTDTGIIKIGDGTNGWSDIDPAFGSEYLPLLGTAANSELLDGISSAGFVQSTEVSTSATADTVARRLSDGTLRVAAAATSGDAPQWGQTQTEIGAQITTATPGIRAELVSRTVTANFTIAATDVGAMVLANHSSVTAFVTATLPTNATVAIAVGSWIDICAIGNGLVKIVGAGGVTVLGPIYVFPNYGIVRVLKTGTNQWNLIPIGNNHQQKFPKMRVYRATTTINYVTGQWHGVAFNTLDTANTLNPGDEWFTIPGTGIETARRIVVNQDGEYFIGVNFSGNNPNSCYTRVAKLTADNTPGATLATTAAITTQSLGWRGRIVAGESIGATHLSVTVTDVGQIDDTGVNGNRNDLVIYRLGN